MKKRTLKPRKARRPRRFVSRAHRPGLGAAGSPTCVGRADNPIPPSLLPQAPLPPQPPTSRFNKAQAVPGSNTRRSYSRHERGLPPPLRGDPYKRLALPISFPLACPLSHFLRPPPSPSLPSPGRLPPAPTHPPIHDIARELIQAPARTFTSPRASPTQCKPGAPCPRPRPCYGPRLVPPHAWLHAIARVSVWRWPPPLLPGSQQPLHTHTGKSARPQLYNRRYLYGFPHSSAPPPSPHFSGASA